MPDRPSQLQVWSLALFVLAAFAFFASTLPGCNRNQNAVCARGEKKWCREVDIVIHTPRSFWKDRVVRCDCVPVELEVPR